MDSRLDPFFKTQFRQAEAPDTRQGIRRHEEQDTGKKKDSGKKQEAGTVIEDDTTVSVRALLTFLQQLLGDSAAPQTGGENISVSAPAGTQSGAMPATPRAAQASKAYARTYQATHAQTPPAPAAAPAIALTSEEIRMMHRLIADLTALDSRRIETLTLRPSVSFLQSVTDAVNRLK